MKGLQNLISRYLKDHEKHKKYLAFVLTLSIIVTFAVPMSLIMPAVSMTKDDGDSVQVETMSADNSGDVMLKNAAGEDGNIVDNTPYSPAEMSAKVLLIGTNPSNSGSGDWAEGLTTPEQIISAAKDEFFLGIAHDFCAFIENDFNPKAADAEGRVAVGGDFTFISNNCQWNYQVGSGDYGSAKSLNNTIYYQDNSGYAHAIVGGKMVNINTASTGSGVKKYKGKDNYDETTGYHTVNRGNEYSYTFFYKPEEDLFKRFVVGNIDDSYHYEYPSNESVPYSTDHAHDYPGDCKDNLDEDGEDQLHPYLGHVNEKAQIYEQPSGGLINFENEFNWMRKRSKALANTASTGTTTINGGELVFTCPSDTKSGDTVYFDIPDGWTEDKFSSIKFNDVPVGDFTDAFGTVVHNYPLCNLVVNCGGNTFQIGPEDSYKDKIDTYINGDLITLYADDGTNSDSKKNNHPASERILYNFYEATSGQLTTNFNGTIFAPFADVTTPTGKNGNSAAGHLSGALIAKSFEGYLEFGYRPYRGSSDIVDLTTGYSIHVDKFIADTAKVVNLPGAGFQLIEDGSYTVVAANGDHSTPEIKENAKPYVYTWDSANESVHVPFPTAIDYSGNTDYVALAQELYRPPETTVVTTTVLTTTTLVTTTEETTTAAVPEDDSGGEESQGNDEEQPTEVPVDEEQPTEAPTEEEQPVQVQSNGLQDNEIQPVDADSNDVTNQSKPETYEIIKTYTMQEQKAPEGFFKDETTRYTITVSERIDLSMIQDNIPQRVFVHLKTEKTFINDDGIEETITLPECDIIIENVEGNRIITVTDEENSFEDEFRLTIDEDKKVVSKVEKKESDGWIDVIGGENERPSKAGEYDFGDGRKYCFDPEVIMMMLLPDENPSFENKPAVIFKKVDDLGNLVTNAKIEVLPEISVFDPSSGKCVLNPENDNITPGIEYTITEAAAPEKMELADPIKFKLTKTEENGVITEYKVEYWSVDAEGNKKGESKFLDLLDPSAAEHTITMVDYRKLGAKLNLEKQDYETHAPLSGAEFSIWAENGDNVCSGLVVENGTLNISEDEDFRNLDNKYTRNGYLFPGVYYLTEDKIPEHKYSDKGETYKNPGKIYFTVDDDFNVVSGRSAVIPLTLECTNGWDNIYAYYPVTPSGSSMAETSNTDSLKNIEKVKVNSDKDILKYYYKGGGSESHNSKSIDLSFDTAVDFPQLKMFIEGTDAKLTIEITSADGTKYGYGIDDKSEMKDVNEMLTATGSTLTVYNKTDDGKTDISVEKKWAGDNGFRDLRSDSVTVKLYQTKTKLDDPKTQLKDGDIYKNDDGEELTATLNEANKWTAKWENLDSKDTENGTKYPYYYYVKEVSVPAGYEDSYSTSPDGTLVVTNTLETISVDIEKVWDNKGYAVKLPSTVTFTIQKRLNENEDWSDVKDITLTSANQTEESDNKYHWKKESVKLPAGYEYRIVENSVPFGWKISGKNPSDPVKVNGGTLSITNEIILSSLVITKNWLSDTKSNRPGSVRLALYRTTDTPEDQLPYPPEQSPEATRQDYARLLQYSLYFYDANMCGDQVNEDSAYSWRGNCHTEDGGDILGGFHDAGDHVMFGLAQGYTASIMNWGLYEFSDSYKTLGQTEHIRILSDHFSDFISRCVAYDNDNITKILVQKGNPVIDHKYWGTPEMQETIEELDRTAEQTYTPLDKDGKEKAIKNHSQIYWSDDLPDGGGCGDIAFEYAATLASAYVNAKAGNFGEDAKNDPKYDQYLETAKKLYDFGINQNNTSTSQGENGCYNSGSVDDDKNWAATWLYLATEGSDSKYDQKSNLSSSWKGNYNISWDSVDNAAALLYAGHVSNNPNDKSDIVNTLNDYVKTRQYYVFGGESGGWGNMRHNAAYQAAVLVAAKYAAEDSEARTNLTDWARLQMNVILGDNDAVNANGDKGVCFITGFAENSIQKPHYRATSSDASSVVMRIKDDKSVIDDDSRVENVLIGGLAGGWFTENQSSFEDRRSDYQQTEVACDYNACLTVAAAGLYDFFKTGKTYWIPEGAGIKADKLYLEDGVTEGDYYEIESSPTRLRNAAQTLTLNGLTMNKVSILAADNVIIFDSSHNQELFKQITVNGADVSNLCLGKNVTKIEVSFTNFNGTLELNSGTFLNGSTVAEGGSLSGDVFVLSPQDIGEDSVFTALWNQSNNVLSTEIEKIKCSVWGGSLNYVKLYCDLGNSFTVTPDSAALLPGESTKLTVGTEDSITWEQQSIGSIASNGDGTYTYTAGTAEEISGEYVNVTIKGTDSGELEGSCDIKVYKGLTITANKTGNVYPGDVITFTANVPVKWNGGEDSTIQYTYTVPANAAIGSTITIAGVRGDYSKELSFTVKEKPLTINCNMSEVMVGSTITVTSDEDISDWEISPENVLESPQKSGGSGNYTYSFKVKDNAVTEPTSVTLKAKVGGRISNGVTVRIKTSDFTISADKTELTAGDTFEIISPYQIEGNKWNYDNNVISQRDDPSGVGADGNYHYTFHVKKSAPQSDFTIKCRHWLDNADRDSNIVTIKINPYTFNISSNKTTVKAGDTFEITSDVQCRSWGNISFNYEQNDMGQKIESITERQENGKYIYTFKVRADASAGNIKLRGNTVENNEQINSNWLTINVEAFEFKVLSISSDKVHANESFTITANANINEWSVDNKNKDELFEQTKNDNGELILNVKENAVPGTYTIKLKNNTNNQDYWAEANVEILAPRHLEITAEPSELLPGQTVTLTAKDSETGEIISDSITWTVDGSGSMNGNVFTAGGNSGNVTITASGNGLTGTCKLNVKKLTASPLTLRYSEDGENKPGQLKVTDSDGNPVDNITYEITSGGEYVYISASGKVTPKETGTATFKVKCNGVETDCTGTIEVNGKFAIGRISEMKPNSSIRLTPENAVGSITWSSSDETIATVDQYGRVKSGVTTGKVTITAIDDYDNSEAEWEIEVKEIAETVDTTGMEWVQDIELTSKDLITADQWQKTIGELPIRDGNGNRYYYYIVEVDEKGNPVTQIKGSGAVYIPISYEGNGQSLNADGTPVDLSVSNKKVGETQGELPSAGGEGTKGFYAAGMAIMCGAAAGYYHIRRRRKRVTK